jgi:hypothetical protein
MVFPLIIYPIIGLSFKGTQFYFRTIRKLEIEELPAILNSDQNETSDQKEMMFNVPLPGNTRRSVKKFYMYLIEIILIVNN